MEMRVPDDKRALIAGLSEEQIKKEERRMKLEDSGYDPDDPADVQEYDMLEAMSSEELDERIRKLEGMLGLTPI